MILYEYLKSVPRDQFQNGRFSNVFDALDTLPLDYGGDTVNLYRFYLNRGLNARAQKLRNRVDTTGSAGLKTVLNASVTNPDPSQLAE